MKNLYILTEERPKISVLATILQKFSTDQKAPCFIDNLRILPILEKDTFSFTYELIGFRSNIVNKVFIKTVSGTSSFADFLIFYQQNIPTPTDTPLYAIEETKTDDKESRNTGVYQRITKFIFLNFYYPNTKKIMLYALQIEQKEKPTETYIFGTKLLLTLGVEILGKKLDSKLFTPFTSVQEVIDLKAKMRRAPAGNTPILITQKHNLIEISGRLFKNDSLAHDPKIGALSAIAATLRHLGWEHTITITQHGLSQKHLTPKNKFVQVANALNLSIQGLTLPKASFAPQYWHYDLDGEKLGTIFIHLVVENFTQGYSIFENHAGCEKSYFVPKEGEPIPLAKYKDRTKYKAGDKNQIIHIPDLILLDFARCEVINIEGKKYQSRDKGIAELANYDYIEKHYIQKYYNPRKIIRTVVLYGSTETQLIEIEIGFLLNQNGQLILGVQAPELFKEAIKNLLDFWNPSRP